MSYKRNAPIPVVEGGTGLVTSTTAYAPICGGTTATGAFQAASTGLSTSGWVLTSNGAGALPSFQAPASGGITTINGDSGSVTGATITLTGGTSGAVFTGSGSTMTMSFNTVNLPSTTSTIGQVKVNGTTIINTYQTSAFNTDIFIGQRSGNYTGSSAFGANTALGADCLLALSSGYGNVALGSSALRAVSSGLSNLGIGTDTLRNLTTGSGNVAISGNSGTAYTGSESGNLLFKSTGVTGESNTIRFGSGTGSGTDQFNRTFLHGAYGITPAGTTSSIMIVDSNGQLGTGTPNSTTISLSTDATSTTANLFTGAAVKTVTLGSTNTTSTTTIAGGTGGVQISNTFLNMPTTSSTAGQLRINNSPVLHAYGTNNFFAGSGAGNFTLTGDSNVGVGSFACDAIGNGIGNVGVGYNALTTLTNQNGNVAIGYQSLQLLSTGGVNTGIGYQSLASLATGDYNLALGYQAGNTLNASEDSNIYLNNPGVAGESNTLRIASNTGTGIQNINRAFIAGIRGITTGVNDAIAVLIDSAGQLGTVSSSIRYKENIEDMGDVSSPVMNLRPVTFDFIGKPSHKKQVGLIAEEVKEIMPELVVHNQDGEVESVKYHELPVLLLNELQKALKRIEYLESKLK